jgi:hypothetical protein
VPPIPQRLPKQPSTMKQSLATGDRVAWTADDRGIVVAREPGDSRSGPRLTVAVWRGSAFSGHVTRLPAALLFRTSRLHPSPTPALGSGDLHGRP